MKRSFWLGLVFIIGFLVAFFHQGYTAEGWKELKGDHFIVYYLNDDKFAGEVLKKAELYYNQISDDLGYERYSNFWQWENRVKIQIYPTQDEFLKATGRQNWSHGVANYETKEIRSYVWKEGFVESLLPHEITHLIFRDYVGFKGEVPLWLDEGVAQWEEPAKRAVVRLVMKSYLEKGKQYSIKDLTEIDVRNVKVELAVQLYYVEAASVIDFLAHEHGTDNFTAFCRQLRDGKNLEEALRFSYPTQMRSLTEMEEQWREYISKAPS